MALLLLGSCAKKDPPLLVSVEVKDYDYLESDEIAMDITLRNNTDKSILWDHRRYSTDGTVTDGVLTIASDFHVILSSPTGQKKEVMVKWRQNRSERKQPLLLKFLPLDVEEIRTCTFRASIFDQKDCFNQNSWSIQGVFTGRITVLYKSLEISDYRENLLGAVTGTYPIKESLYMNAKFSKVRLLSPKISFCAPDKPTLNP